jgi:HEAT repeat protein
LGNPERDLCETKNKSKWEAAKALSQIGNPESIQALLGALLDTEFDVR